MDCTIIGTAIGLISGIALGVFGSVIKRRFSDVDNFCDLIWREIDDASTQSENIGGEHCFSKWHKPSKERVAIYAQLLDWNTRTNGQRVMVACDAYEALESGVIGGAGPREAVRQLVSIYRKAKETI